MRVTLGLSGLAVLVLGGTAHSDGWLVAEAPAALTVDDRHVGVFRLGAMPAIGAYVEHDWFAFGLRVRAGVLRDGPSPESRLADPGLGGLTTAGLAARVTLRGAWLEVVGGGGITGRDLVPSVEAGVGWSLPVGNVDIGPSARYVRVLSRDSMDAFGTAELALFGIDVRFGRQRAARRATVEVVAAVNAPESEPVAESVPEPARAPEPAPEAVPEVAPEPEAEAVAVADIPELEILDDRIVLDERVLFDFARARVRTRGRVVIAALVAMWKANPEWQHLTIEGHSDMRGSDEYNLWLSGERARRVRAVMIELGCPEASVSASGLGHSRPRETGSSEEAHQRNRRVEFVIHRRVSKPEAGVP